MENITHFHPVTKSQCVINFAPFQYNYHQQSCIKTHSPDSEYLESIGYDIQKQTEEQTTQLQEQIVLLQSL